MAFELLEPEDPTASVLDRYEKSKKDIRFWMIIATVWEAALVVTLLILIEWSNRTQVVVLVASLLSYGTVGLGIVALGAYMRTNSLRVLTGLELLEERIRSGDA